MVIVHDAETVTTHFAVADLARCVGLYVGRGGRDGLVLGIGGNIFHLNAERFVQMMQHLVMVRRWKQNVGNLADGLSYTMRSR